MGATEASISIRVVSEYTCGGATFRRNGFVHTGSGSNFRDLINPPLGTEKYDAHRNLLVGHNFFTN